MSVDVSIKHRFGDFVLDAAFAANDSRVTALFGPSGSGKTSIINAIAGLLRPHEGRVAINGRVVFDAAQNIFVPPVERRVGYVFQDARLFPHMTVEKNLLFGWRRTGMKPDERGIEEIVALLGLERLKHRYPAHLSGGEKSRVALGRALLSSPEILLLDEPLAALDPARRAEILPYLERLHDETKIALIYVSHALDEVTRLADDIVVLKSGQVAAQGCVFDLAISLDARDTLGAPPLGAVLDVALAAQREDGLSILAFDGGTLSVPRIAREIGAKLRVRIRAEDIMLATEEPQGVSANNVLAARILAMSETCGAHADIQLAIGASKLVARITHASAKRLALAPGQNVYAIIKSVTVDL